MALEQLPHVFIICLGDETSETVQAYNILKEAVRQGDMPVIVITNDEDRKLFLKYTELKSMFFLSRPLSLYALYEMLMDIEDKIDANKGKNAWDFTEYINENPEKGIIRKHILVVDDDTEQLINIKEQLKEFYDVTVVKSGDVAFRFLEKKAVNLILLDYLMPEMDGPAVFGRLRDDPVLRKIPVIFLTGMTERETVIKTLTELKPQGYIVKPAKKSELVAKIIDVLG
ncbi:MAG: response regulator [Lachnospiraceae bacterium]|nr:response regulator [Lachnospiraceae bacterium]